MLTWTNSIVLDI